MNQALATGTKVTIVEGPNAIETTVKAVLKNGRQVIVEATLPGFFYNLEGVRNEIDRPRIFTIRKNGAFVESDSAFNHGRGGRSYLEF